MIENNERLTALKGIGPKTAALFTKLNILTVGDLLQSYPRSYETYEPVQPLAQAQFCTFGAFAGVIRKNIAIHTANRITVSTTEIADEEGAKLRLTWFNMPYLRNTLKAGMRFVFRGRIHLQGTTPVMEQPQFFSLAAYEEKIGTFWPVYPLTAGLGNKTIQKAVQQVLEQGALPDTLLPQETAEHYALMSFADAVRQIHFPTGEDALLAAHRRLAFEEFFTFILQIRRLKKDADREPNHFQITRHAETEQLIHTLPYCLTGAQKRVLEEITDDLCGPFVMNRLVQGDVGSGKTIVAFLAIYQVVLSGYQAVMMAPTEVLARQHSHSIQRLLDTAGISLRVVLLTGSMSRREKQEAYEQIRSGEAHVVIGTHALIQDPVVYHQLALVITDEQHRFGVRQRETLKAKGMCPHVLVMSATPIPRTLAIVIYGDLSISVMDELPANRLPIKNCVVNIQYRPKAYQFIRDEVQKGHQAYVICPMVEASEVMEGEDVISYSAALREALPPGIQVAYLHGKMKQDQKDAIMASFAANEIQVLVSTTVIEVGIDVPNATVIMIENAERFGLASLHQLRGRVGRGAAQSYCILVNTSGSPQSKARLEILNHSNDGFFIASEDLKLRGPGDLFGVRQSGLLAFRIGDIYQDAQTLQEASEAVDAYLETHTEIETLDFAGGLFGESFLNVTF